MTAFVRSSAGLCKVARLAALLAVAPLWGCETGNKLQPPAAQAPVAPPATSLVRHPLTAERPEFLRLGNLSPNRVPVRVGILLPFTDGSAATRVLAASMMKAAEMALYDANNRNILLMSADEGSTSQASADAARELVAEGAEVIVGPLFSQATSAAAPVAEDRGIPIISFSTDRKVAGNGVYLLSFLPGAEVQRVVSYAASQGHAGFAALVPQNAYGDRIGEDFEDDVKSSGGRITDIEKYVPATDAILAPVHAVAQSKPDAILLAQGGPLLRELASSLAGAGISVDQVKLLGTGLWDDPSTARDPLLVGGLFAAPPPEVDRDFVAKYREIYGASPPQLASLAYDAVSLVALLANGPPYKRFTAQALTDPNGFAGVDGIFRFRSDGTSERGLAVLTIDPGGAFRVVSPAPTTFQGSGT